MNSVEGVQLPKILINYNRFLDPIFIFYCQNNPELKARGWNDWVPPEREVLQKRIESYREVWKNEGEKMLKAGCEVLDLSFYRNVIDVHVVSGNPRGFSYPIITKSGFTPEEFIREIVHELLHVLIQDNAESGKITRILPSTYFSEENQLTRNHLIIYAIFSYIYLEILHDADRLEKDKAYAARSTYPEYSHAWEIVEKEGYKNVINVFKDKCYL